MAVLPIRCCSNFMFSPINPSPTSRTSLFVTFKTHFRGKAAVFPVDMELLSGSTSNPESNLLKSSAKVHFCLFHLPFENQDFSKIKRKAHQVRQPTAAVLVANILSWCSPLQALAETCDADNSFKMPIILLVSLIGATVGGLLARQRRGELKRLNEQLRQINSALRRQAKIESYAPSLSYAPSGSKITEDELIIDPRKPELTARLKSGKNFLRIQSPEQAYVEFKMALDLARSLKDPIDEKKAARGLGASLQRQGKYKEAINYHSMVLTISGREGEDSGNTEAYGAIADCYTELGDLERAASYYDKYIARLEKD